MSIKLFNQQSKFTRALFLPAPPPPPYLRNNNKINNQRISLFFDRIRLQELERESEQLDESFQSYLRRQKMMKRQMNDDVTHIWDSYNLSKAALEQYDCVSGQANLMHNQPKCINTTNIDRALSSGLNDNDDDSILREFQEIRQVKSPQFEKGEIFPRETVFGNKKPVKAHDTNVYTMARERLQKEFDELSALALKTTTPTSISKKWNPMKEKEIEVWKCKVNENNMISSGRDLQQTIDEFYRKRDEKFSENESEKHCKVRGDKTIPLNAGDDIQSNTDTRSEQENSPTKRQDNILAAKSNQLNPEIEAKGSTNALMVQDEQGPTDFKKANESKSSDNDSENIGKVEHIESTVIITSRIAKLNLNESSTEPKEVFTKLSSIESGENSSLQISIGPAQPSKSDDFWI